MTQKQKKDHAYVFVVFLFSVLSLWWILLNVISIDEYFHHQIFASVYGVMALVGAVYGFRISRAWGGLRSILGRAITFFSLGLLSQEFGQLAYSYYIYFEKIDVPYPSVGDVGFFGSIIFYTYAVWLLAKAVGVKFSLRSITSKLQAILIPFVVLIASYLYFLQEYDFDWSQPLTIFLDFGYPLGAAVYISLALLAFLLSRRVLGGVMRYRVLIILLALLLQYLADFTFLYQSSSGTWTVGGINDYMYLIAYFAMTLGVLQLRANLIKKSISEG
jgi:hypothetical protein